MNMTEIYQAQNPVILRLSEIIGSLSYALDLTEGLPPGHSLRSCWVGMHIGYCMGLNTQELSRLYYTILLKDAGCSSNAARLFELYGSDDHVVKRDFKTVDTDHVVNLGRFVMSHVAIGKAWRERFGRIVTLARNGEALATELIETRCERGASIARELGFDEQVAAGIRSLDEHWNGNGKPARLSGQAIPLGSRIALLSQVVDVFHSSGGAQAARETVRQRIGSWFDPEVAGAFDKAQTLPGFWNGLGSREGLQTRVMELEPRSECVLADDDRLDRIAEAFARVVDAKSHFTYGHSSRVACYAEAVAAQMGLPVARQRWLRRAALLHDIGKLGVSNEVLDKPGRLDAQEWEKVKTHAAYSEQILSRLGAFSELAFIAAAHHERLDGKGYPRGLAAADIPLETRIITVADIFDAITAERPYRGAIPVSQALAMMEKECGTAIDADCLQAMKRAAPWESSLPTA